MESLESPAGHNPLVTELEEFAAAIRGEPSRMTTVEEGTRAVSLANLILESIEVRREKWSAAALGGETPWIDAPS